MQGNFRRGAALVGAFALAFNATAAGVDALIKCTVPWVAQVVRGHPGQFTAPPPPINRGPRPGRAPETRGGMWSEQALEDARESAEPLWACLSPEPAFFNGGGHTLVIAAAPGSSMPWEGSASSSCGSVNTANGDKLTVIPLVSWKCRGGMVLDFTLYHNSETNYTDELGYGWTWTYDVYIKTAGSTSTVHWGDGGCIPYTLTSGNYVPPAGIHDALVHNTDGTWTLTKKDQTTYSFNTSGFLTQIQDRHGNAISITLNAQN